MYPCRCVHDVRAGRRCVKSCRSTRSNPSDYTGVAGMSNEGVGSAAQIKAIKQAEFANKEDMFWSGLCGRSHKGVHRGCFFTGQRGITVGMMAPIPGTASKSAVLVVVLPQSRKNSQEAGGRHLEVGVGREANNLTLGGGEGTSHAWSS